MKKPTLKHFYVLNSNFNKQSIEPYDVIPHLVDEYNKLKKKPVSFSEFKDFVNKEAMYQWWGRCEYEIVISHWPPVKDLQEKWDIYQQIKMNMDVVTDLVMQSVLKQN